MLLNGRPVHPRTMLGNLMVWAHTPEASKVVPDWGHTVRTPDGAVYRAYRVALTPAQIENPCLRNMADPAYMWAAVARFGDAEHALLMAMSYDVYISGKALSHFGELPAPKRSRVWRFYDRKCVYCGRPTRLRVDISRGAYPDDMATIDHVVPTALGGDTEWGNVVNACRACNARKGDMTLEAFMGCRHGEPCPQADEFRRQYVRDARERVRQWMELSWGRKWLWDGQGIERVTLVLGNPALLDIIKG